MLKGVTFRERGGVARLIFLKVYRHKHSKVSPNVVSGFSAKHSRWYRISGRWVSIHGLYGFTGCRSRPFRG